MHDQKSNHAIETITTSDGHRQFRLYLPFREGRGLIEDPKITILRTINAPVLGFSMRITGEDGSVEHIGDMENPLPLELYNQGLSDEGLIIVNINELGSVVDGQLLWFNEHNTEKSPAP